ncbi:MAG TPA: hypothetical protein VFX06_04035 [Stellaceae bacterium]|nr:hypothetical protein [Stellaceae bacterium]
MADSWRIRVKVGKIDDYTREAWDRCEVGVWYGAWSAQDFRDAVSQKNVASATYLRNLPDQKNLAWNESDSFFYPAIKFGNIPNGDWIVVFLRETQEIGVAQICAEIQSEKNHPLNLYGETFKFRKLADKKKFKLSHLPGAYCLLPAQGRGNVHRFNGMQGHVDLLVKSQAEEDVSQALHQMQSEEFLDFLGAAEWESFCTAYLIIEEDLVPTGVSTGRTLPVFDIVGRRRRDGSRLYAQCKKDPNPQLMREEFLAVCSTLGPDDTAYFFGYGGCNNNNGAVTVFDKNSALNWLNTENGRHYFELFAAP